MRSASKLASEVAALETIVNQFLTNSAPPQQVSEAMIDHDYTILAIKRYNEGAREHWSSTLRGMKKVEASVVEPVRSFLNNDLRNLKEARRTLDVDQKAYDSIVARYAGQAKTKEASSLREDAFQLYEARKSYLRSSMAFCQMEPNVRCALDKLLVRIFCDQWREMKNQRESTATILGKWDTEMNRVRGWSRELEEGEKVFKKELQMARKDIEERADNAVKPSRELEDYTASTVPYLGSQPTMASVPSPAKPGFEKNEKQGWLFQKTQTGKPARTFWVRRWFFVKNGIFGWLVQGARSGAVEESEKIGVLLCGTRPAFQEERRFCFEVKTKDSSIALQAETQNELTEWLSAFDGAKRKAMEDPGTTDSPVGGSQPIDPAFAITPPIAPEFAAKVGEHASHTSDDMAIPDRASTLGIPDAELAKRGSFDVSRRATSTERDAEPSGRDHAARIIQKLDLHRKSEARPMLSGSAAPAAAGGIASLISASHNVLPVGPGGNTPSVISDTRIVPAKIPPSTLAPNTLASPPAPTNLSSTAVIVSGERGVGLGRRDGGIPSGLMANLWGSTNWGYLNRLERGEIKAPAMERDRSVSQPPSPVEKLDPEVTEENKSRTDLTAPTPPSRGVSPGTSPPAPVHRKTISTGTDLSKAKAAAFEQEFPNYYPLALRAQDAQFRVLFPNVPREEKAVLVFRATWGPNDVQEFPGRVYVTTREIYFYSNHLGLVLVNGRELSLFEEVTAAPGKDCDFLFMHFQESAKEEFGAHRITIKTFLEPLKLLQRRLNFLVRNSNAPNPASLEEVLKTLIRMEVDDSKQSPDQESWEEVDYNTPVDGSPRRGDDMKRALKIDGNLFPSANDVKLNKSATKFKLPTQPVVYAPQGMARCAADKTYDVSAKALFHVLFGDKSAVFQMLYRERLAANIRQTPWVQPDQGHYRREFEYEIDRTKFTGTAPTEPVTDHQVIEVLNEHLCYVVSDKKVPWYLPASQSFTLNSRFVITHVAKSRCKLAIFTKVDWIRPPQIGQHLIEQHALHDLELEAADLIDVVDDQVAKLGAHSSGTRKAAQIFGNIAQQTQPLQIAAQDIPPPTRQRRFRLRPRNLNGLLVSELVAQIRRLVAWSFSSLIAMVGSIGKICSTHNILVSLLLLSAAYNIFDVWRDSTQWWHERSATAFMVRVGVTPNPMMSRAVYLHDIDDLLFNQTGAITTDLEMAPDNGNRCVSTFRDIVEATDLDASFKTTAASRLFTEYSTQSTARRLRRTRQHMGAYRHDLLVAMRVVNALEKETIRAEYENWLMDEHVRCQKVGSMLNSTTKVDKDSAKMLQVPQGGGDLNKWYADYCGSCRAALDALNLDGKRRRLATL